VARTAGGRTVHPITWLLLAVTALGLALRTAGLGQDLWIDEFITLNDLATRSPGDLLSSYTSANQHVLNSVLVWASIHVFGEAEWSVRLPAVLFGVATIPVMYWVGRLARFERVPALAGALLLALSYHHIWFSQNARGYTGYLLFSLLTTGALFQVLRSAGARWIVLFIVASALNFLALLTSVFVFGAQVVGAAAVLWAAHRRGESDAPRLRRVAFAFGGAAAAAILIFSPLALEILQVLSESAPRQGTAFQVLSLRFLREVLAGSFPGVGAGWILLAVIPGAAVVWGMLLLAQRTPLITGIGLGCHLLFVGASIVLGWPVYPRLFIFGLPFVILALLAMTETVAVLVPRSLQRVRAVAGSLALSLLVLGSALMLPRLYRFPKQPFRAGLAEAARLSGPDGFLIAIGSGNHGFRYYAGQRIELMSRLGTARTLEAFETILRDHPRHQLVLLTTLNRALRRQSPALWNAMQRGWQPSVRFEGTLGDGSVTIWLPRARGDSVPRR
jgi:mannosyltransferase